MQLDAILQRFDISDQGTFGRLLLPLRLYSGELPPRGNRPNISSVPAGNYWCFWTPSPRFRRLMYLVADVPARTGVRLHPANLMGDLALGYKAQLNGCIAFGEQLGWINGQKALLLSAPAMRRLEAHFGGRPFRLEICDL